MLKLKSSSLPLLLFSLLVCFPLSHGHGHGHGTPDGSEQWGYVQVRPKAHMFWWLYRSPQRVDNGSTPWPTVLWLQGGPGGSGVGVGNFQEVGPLDTDLKPRNSTWLQKADLLFVDNPVGTGYSFVEEDAALVKTDWEAATDLTTLLKKLYNKNNKLQKSPLYIVAESYGGKYAVTVGLSIVKAVKAGQLKLKLGGLALGDSWISPLDFVFSWAPVLRDVSRLDINSAIESNKIAEKIKQQIEKGQYEDATNSWNELESQIVSSSNNIDFYNFLQDDSDDSTSVTTDMALSGRMGMKRYSRYLTVKASTTGHGFMNGVIRKKLKIIPKNVIFGGQSDLVFEALSGDFMKPRIHEVDELLAMGVNVTVYNGQVDLICATKGTEAWVQKLKWKGLKHFNNLNRKPLYCGDGSATKGFVKSYQNFNFYWILGAGHFVPVDQPCTALKMLGEITRSPASDISASS